MIRLQKAIADSGFCSRRKAEEYIIKGKVFVNGNKVTELGTKVDDKDEIIVDDNVISKQEKEYYVFYKPRGVISSTNDDKGRKTVVDFFNSNKRLYPVGRLDYDTTGLIILTNDGELTNFLIHPKNNIEKVYVAKIKGLIQKEDLKKICNGVIIDGKKTSRAKAKILKIDKKTNSSLIELIIHEGKNHQVKKMFEAIGYSVIKLKRESISFLTLDGLKSGDYRELSVKEVKMLYAQKNSQE